MSLPTLLPADMDARLHGELYRIPEHCRQGLLDYLRYGLPPGSFLHAVLANDLKQAAARADEANQRALYDYVYVLYNYCPGTAWGSPSAVRDWIEAGMALRRQQDPDVMRMDEVRRS